MKMRQSDAEFDRELADLPSELRWREWMRRIEAVLFASATPVAREDLARVVGQRASVDLLIEDLAVDLEGRPYEVAQVGAGWMLRTRPAYAPAIRAAADVGGQVLNLSEFDLAVLAAIAGAGEGEARSQTATTATGKDAARLAAQLLGYFDTRTALPLDHPRIAECVDESAAAPFLDQLRGNLVAVLAGAFIEDHFGPQRAGRIQLHPRRIAGHHDGCGNAEPPCRPCNALRVVPARHCDHAARFFVFGQGRKPVPGAAYLECANGLEHLGLYPALRIANRNRQKRCRRQDRSELCRRFDDTFSGGHAIRVLDHIALLAHSPM